MNDKYPEEVLLKPWGVELAKMMEEENEAKVFQPDFFQLQPSSP